VDGGRGFGSVCGCCAEYGSSPASPGYVRLRFSDATKVGDDQARARIRRQDLTKRVCDWVKMSPLFWEQDPYRAELFRLCRDNQDVGGNQLADALRGQLPETTLHRLVLVWNAWRYALESI
jgi:hypothetical protein